MLPVSRKTYLLFFLLNMMFSCPQNTVEACNGTVITACNDTTVEACNGTVITACNDNTTCVQTYEELYKSLGSSINYFNISQALYPAKWLSSLLVHVTLHGANGIEKCRPAKYTWSMSCLFAAFPEYVLEVLSLCSIVVTPRTQKLKILITPFCCNVSQEDRVTMIDTVLAAVSNKVNYINLNILFFQFAVGGKESTLKISDIKMFTYHYVVNNEFKTPPLIKSPSIYKPQRWEENGLYYWKFLGIALKYSTV